MRLQVTHRTRYSYGSPIVETLMEVRLKPRAWASQRLEQFRLSVSPPAAVSEYVDGFGNPVHYFGLMKPHDHVEVVSHLVVETGLPPDLDEDSEFLEDFLMFRGPIQPEPAIQALAGRFQGRLDDLARHINAAFTYRPNSTDVHSSVAEVIELKEGVCQDFAHVFIATCRAMRIPARYVSGYIHSGTGIRGSAASHAWAEAWIDGAGWVGFDPTNPVRETDGHIKVAVGRDYLDCAPTRGTYVGLAQETLTVEVATNEL